MKILKRGKKLKLQKSDCNKKKVPFFILTRPNMYNGERESDLVFVEKKKQF